MIKNKDEVSGSEILFLLKEEKALFNTHIRPLLKNPLIIIQNWKGSEKTYFINLKLWFYSLPL